MVDFNYVELSESSSNLQIHKMVHFKFDLQCYRKSTCGLRLSKIQFVSLPQAVDADFPIHSLLLFIV